ncbi:MAG: GNAT family N-acetyltransferase [Gammaproteobacteria bacterium]|nr:GNAT family N-acetyltransferase [Gammaproteobacteria bacterium]
MAKADNRLHAASVEVMPVDPSSPEAQACLDQYYEELASRFVGGFDRNLDGTAADALDYLPPNGTLLIVRLSGEVVGCGAIRAVTPGVGEIKRMWISPNARGLGLSRKLLGELERVAERNSIHTLRLDTNRSLTEALHLYRSAGYREIARFNDNPYAHHWFEKVLPTACPGSP